VNAKQIWQTALERLQAKVEPSIFASRFQETFSLNYEEETLTVAVPTNFVKAHLEDRFIDLIRSVLSDILGCPIEVRFEVFRGVSQPSLLPEGGELLPAPGKRANRTTRGRPAVVRREQHRRHIGHIADEAAAAMNLIAPIASSSSAHLSTGEEKPREQASLFNLLEQAESVEAPDAAMPSQTTIQAPGGEGPVLGPLPPQDGSSEGVPFSFSMPMPHEGLLNPRYTFKAFIVGKSNQLAHGAALAVAENPGRVYNPLFFYGGVGLGKTHLLHAIGHAGEASGLNVLYVTSEKFTNEIINAIRFQKTEEFRAKYRQIDILLVDDIQFIVGKESTEEEFFHTFNTLHNANKQIVVTSDRPPKAIHSLHDRLRSRFEWGLLADIQPPDYEHRLAILRSKAELLHFPVSNSVIEYVARPECSSVRELEGALNRVIAYGTLHGAPLTPQLAAQALAHIYNEAKPASASLSAREVMEGVCRYYSVDAARMRGKQRDREIAWPRQVAMYLMREETTASLLQIGIELGGRDHTTIMHGWEKVHAEMATNERVRREVAAVIESLRRS
jgi:chromosomal replication initiator protein